MRLHISLLGTVPKETAAVGNDFHHDAFVLLGNDLFQFKAGVFLHEGGHEFDLHLSPVRLVLWTKNSSPGRKVKTVVRIGIADFLGTQNSRLAAPQN